MGSPLPGGEKGHCFRNLGILECSRLPLGKQKFYWRSGGGVGIKNLHYSLLQSEEDKYIVLKTSFVVFDRKYSYLISYKSFLLFSLQTD